MSKIKYSALVSDVRNKLNGSVLSKNRFGNYIRNKTTPVNPQTTFQQNARALLSANSQAWAGITEAQRNGWRALAQTMPFTDIFGDPKTLTGQMMYVKLNTNLEKMGEAAIADAPAKEAIPFVEATLLVATVAGGVITALNMTIAPATVPAGFEIAIYATPPVNAGISFVKNQFRFLGVAPAPAVGVIDLEPLWNARFGSAVAGQRIFVRLALVSSTSGQQGIPAQVVGVVSA
jgi:hypothetical protein